jgi:hypothetical protein
LLGQLGKHPGNDSSLREALAVDIYQLRIKDPAKSRKSATDWLQKSPSATGADRIAACLIDQAADESTVKTDLETITRSALDHPQIKTTGPNSGAGAARIPNAPDSSKPPNAISKEPSWSASGSVPKKASTKEPRPARNCSGKT